MKRIAVFFPVLVAALFGQSSTPVVAMSTFYDTDDAAAYVAFSKVEDRKLYELALKEDPALRSVTLSERLYGGNPAPVGRFRLVVLKDGYVPASPAIVKAVYQKLGVSQEEFARKSTAMRKRTGATLRERVVSTSGDQLIKLVEGDITRTDVKKITLDRASDYYAMERDQYLPIHQQMVKDGKIKSWSVWAIRSPAGADRKYDAVTTTVFKNLEAAMANLAYTQTFATVFPKGSYASLAMRSRAVVKTSQIDYWRVHWSVSR
jgi:hypothetical protein